MDEYQNEDAAYDDDGEEMYDEELAVEDEVIEQTEQQRAEAGARSDIQRTISHTVLSSVC